MPDALGVGERVCVCVCTHLCVHMHVCVLGVESAGQGAGGPAWAWGIVCRDRGWRRLRVAGDRDEQEEWGHSSRKLSLELGRLSGQRAGPGHAWPAQVAGGQRQSVAGAFGAGAGPGAEGELTPGSSAAGVSGPGGPVTHQQHGETEAQRGARTLLSCLNE